MANTDPIGRIAEQLLPSVEHPQIKLQSGIVEFHVALQIDARPIFAIGLQPKTKCVEAHTDAHMLPGVVFQGGAKLQNRSNKIIVLQIKDLDAGADEPFWGQCDIHAQVEDGQGGGEFFLALFVDQSAHLDAQIDGHHVNADTGGQIDTFVLKKGVAVIQLVDVQIEEGVDRRAGGDGDDIAVVVLDGNVIEDSSIAVAPEGEPDQIQPMAPVFGKTPQGIGPKDRIGRFQVQRFLHVDVYADAASDAYIAVHGRQKHADVGAEFFPGFIFQVPLLGDGSLGC
jgi:hypothetical protein